MQRVSFYYVPILIRLTGLRQCDLSRPARLLSHLSVLLILVHWRWSSCLAGVCITSQRQRVDSCDRYGVYNAVDAHAAVLHGYAPRKLGAKLADHLLPLLLY